MDTEERFRAARGFDRQHGVEIGASRDRRPSRCLASISTVGASNRLRIAISTLSAARMRPISRVASNECPPSSKKLSSMPTAVSPSVSANSPHSTSSWGVRGSRRIAATGASGAGSAAPVELAVRRQRQPGKQHERRRHHVVRQQTRKMRPQRRGIRRRHTVLRHHIGDETKPTRHLRSRRRRLW